VLSYISDQQIQLKKAHGSSYGPCFPPYPLSVSEQKGRPPQLSRVTVIISRNYGPEPPECYTAIER